jgi:hypothetical protein
MVDIKTDPFAVPSTILAPEAGGNEELKFTNDPDKATDPGWIFFPDFEEERKLTPDEVAAIGATLDKLGAPKKEAPFIPLTEEGGVVQVPFDIAGELGRIGTEGAYAGIKPESVEQWAEYTPPPEAGGVSEYKSRPKVTGRAAELLAERGYDASGYPLKRTAGIMPKGYSDRYKAMYDRSAWEQHVIKDILGGKNPFDLDINERVRDSEINLPKLFKEVFPKYAWVDRDKLNANEKNHWNDEVKAYRGRVEKQAATERAEGISKYNFLMASRDNYMKEVEARAKVKPPKVWVHNSEENIIRQVTPKQADELINQDPRWKLGKEIRREPNVTIYNHETGRKMTLSPDKAQQKMEEDPTWTLEAPITTRREEPTTAQAYNNIAKLQKQLDTLYKEYNELTSMLPRVTDKKIKQGLQQTIDNMKPGLDTQAESLKAAIEYNKGIIKANEGEVVNLPKKRETEPTKPSGNEPIGTEAKVGNDIYVKQEDGKWHLKK